MLKKIVILLFALLLTFEVYGKGYSSSSSSYSSSRSSSSSSSSRPSSSSSSRPSSSSSSSSRPSSGKSYSSGKSSGSSPSAKPSFFNRAEKAQARSVSKASYEKYNANKQSYDYLKTQPKEVYTTRTTRQQTAFKNYYTAQPPVVMYRDTSWSPFFWMWLVDHQDRQAEWVYHHRDQLSDERYRDLVEKNKDLATQVKALEDKKVAKDPNFAPTGVDKDLMYSDDYVKQVQKDAEVDNDFDWFTWLVVAPIGLFALGFIVLMVVRMRRL